MEEIKVAPCGDSALSVEFENEISEAVHLKVSRLMEQVEHARLTGVIELIPTYRSLMICYDPEHLGFGELKQMLEELMIQPVERSKKNRTVVEIPVCYSPEFGPDLEFVAQHNHLSVEEVIRIHTQPKYLIYMLGFTPGFPYLGGMDRRISTPRLEEPRTKIPGGSVGIAGKQTGLYPISSPGGWRIIGRTPLKLYDPFREAPILLKASQHLRFHEISLSEYESIQKQVEKGDYQWKPQN